MRLLICSDGSERSRRAIAFAAIIATATRAETTIFGIAQNQQKETKLKEILLRERSRRGDYAVKRPPPTTRHACDFVSASRRCRSVVEVEFRLGAKPPERAKDYRRCRSAGDRPDPSWDCHQSGSERSHRRRP